MQNIFKSVNGCENNLELIKHGSIISYCQHMRHLQCGNETTLLSLAISLHWRLHEAAIYNKRAVFICDIRMVTLMQVCAGQGRHPGHRPGLLLRPRRQHVAHGCGQRPRLRQERAQQTRAEPATGLPHGHEEHIQQGTSTSTFLAASYLCCHLFNTIRVVS